MLMWKLDLLHGLMDGFISRIATCICREICLLDLVNILNVLVLIIYKGTLIGFCTPAPTKAPAVVLFF